MLRLIPDEDHGNMRRLSAVSDSDSQHEAGQIECHASSDGEESDFEPILVQQLRSSSEEVIGDMHDVASAPGPVLLSSARQIVETHVLYYSAYNVQAPEVIKDLEISHGQDPDMVAHDKLIQLAQHQQYAQRIEKSLNSPVPNHNNMNESLLRELSWVPPRLFDFRTSEALRFTDSFKIKVEYWTGRSWGWWLLSRPPDPVASGNARIKWKTVSCL
jgi:hypothetical protein